MKPDWKIDSPICSVGCTSRCIGTTSRQVYIPKADGRQRPLGVAALEDKIVQQAVVTILNQIYESTSKAFLTGSDRGAACWRWTRWRWASMEASELGARADIRGFFDNMNHEWTMKFIEHRVADRRILHLIQRWLKAGIEGESVRTEARNAQGAVVSPLLANVYLHYVFDLWVEAWRKKSAMGEVIVVRYADDLVVGFQYRTEAERFLREFRERPGQVRVGITCGQDTTDRLRRFAARDRKQRGEEAGDLYVLGFTHYCRQRNSNGLSSSGDYGEEADGAKQSHQGGLQRRKHHRTTEVGAWLRKVVLGYYQYHAVPGNSTDLRILLVASAGAANIARPSQSRAQVGWDRLYPLRRPMDSRPHVLHPYPIWLASPLRIPGKEPYA